MNPAGDPCKIISSSSIPTGKTTKPRPASVYKPPIEHHSHSLAALAFALADCAACSTGKYESLLTEAGFVAHTPKTPKQKELYAAAPSYKVERITANGKTIYAYKDEKKGIAYVGDEAAYQHYKQLATRQSFDRSNYEADQMNQQMSTDWYGAYGPYGTPDMLIHRY